MGQGRTRHVLIYTLFRVHRGTYNILSRYPLYRYLVNRLEREVTTRGDGEVKSRAHTFSLPDQLVERAAFCLFVSHLRPMGPNVLGYQSHLLQCCQSACGHEESSHLSPVLGMRYLHLYTISSSKNTPHSNHGFNLQPLCQCSPGNAISTSAL